MNSDNAFKLPEIPGVKGWQPLSSLNGLTRTDMVRHKSNPLKTYVVTTNYGERVTAVDTVDITNPNEWEVFR